MKLRLALLLALVVVGALAADLADEMVFSVPLLRNGNVQAAMAAGETAPESLGGPTSTRTPNPGQNDTFVTMFPTGMTNQALAWPAAGNVPPEAGTLTFWVQGQGWDPTAATPDTLATFTGPGGDLQIRRQGDRQLLVQVGEQLLTAPFAADPAQVRYLALTWDADAVVLYLDGQELARLEDPALPATYERLIVGQIGPGDPEVDKLIDDVKIYGRPLTRAEVAQQFWRESKIAPRREAVILKTDRKITIDGKIDPEEWADATKLTGLVHTVLRDYVAGTRLLSDDQTFFYVTWDDANLYVAMDSPIPENVRNDPHMTAGMGGLLKVSRKKHDVDVDADDAMEINIVVPPVDGGLYRLTVNGLNVTYDYTTGGDHPDSPVEGIDINWEPEWEVANQVDIRTWQVEARIPLEDIVNVAHPEPGTVWGMNFRRLWQKLRTEGSAWTDGFRHLDDRSFHLGAYAKGLPGLVRFEGSQGMTVRLDDVGMVNFGRLGLTGEIIARGPGGKVRLDVTSNTGEVTAGEELEVPADGAVPFEIVRRFKDPTTTMLDFRVTNVASGAEIFRMEIPSAIHSALRIASRSYPSFGAYSVELDLSGLADVPLEELSAMILLQDARTRQVRLKEIVRELRSYRHKQELDIRALPEGNYEVRVVAFRGEEPVVSTTMEWEKLPMPEWFDNDIGNSDKVPYPFEPIVVDGDRIDVWGRRHNYGDGLFPAQITVLNRQLLRGPITVLATGEDGKPVAAKLTGQEWLEQRDARIEGVRQGQAGPFRVSNSFWMEYDGFMWNRLVVQTEGREKLHELKLVIPFSKEFSDVINPYDYSLRETGEIPAEGWHGAIRPVWVGNAVGGLQWLAEHDGPWQIDDVQREIVVTNDPPGATMTVTFVNIPVSVNLPLELEFGLVATPVKDSRTVDYRAPHIGWGYAWYSPGHEFGPGIQAYNNPGQRRWIRDYRLHGPWPKTTPIPRRELRSYTGPYVTTMAVRTDTDAFRQFGDEWYLQETERVQSAEGRRVQTSQNAKSFQDYFVYQYWKLMELNPYASLYYDVSSEATGSNPYAGLGYLRRDGTRVSSRAILGNREIMRRLYTMVKERCPDAIIKNHNSGTVNMAYMSFCDHFVEGECTINMLTQDRRNYRGKIRPDTYRAEMMGHNFGYVTDFLYQFTRSGMWTYDSMVEAGPDIVDHIWGMTLLHDCATWDAYAPSWWTLRWKKPLYRHGWGMQWQFVPYWEQGITTLPRDDLYASFYLEPATSQVIAIVYNDSEWSGEVRLPLDWSKLPFHGRERLQISNAAHHRVVPPKPATKRWDATDFHLEPNADEYARIEGDDIVFPMTPWNYRMIIIWQIP